MNTVKHSAKTTATLIIFILGLVALAKWCDTIPHEAVYFVQRTLSNQIMLEPAFRIIQSISFWSLLIVSVEYAIISDCSGFKVFRAFAVPLTISVIVAVAALIPEIRFHWFWAGYFILLIFGIKSSFKKLSSLNGSTNKLFSFIKELGKKSSIQGNSIDYYVIYVTKVLLLTLFVALVLSLTIFCVINRNKLGLS